LSISGLLLSEKADAGAEFLANQLSAIKRHNRQLFHDLVGACQHGCRNVQTNSFDQAAAGLTPLHSSQGPWRGKYAVREVRDHLASNRFVLRTDVKSYYASIDHLTLLEHHGSVS
jgi:hypothetical protein